MVTETKVTHTPGPWSYETDDSALNAVVYGKGRKQGQRKQHVAEVWSGDDRSTEVAEANARLIAAAPEMLEAIRKALNEITWSSVEGSNSVVDALSNAIAKAEGK